MSSAVDDFTISSPSLQTDNQPTWSTNPSAHNSHSRHGKLHPGQWAKDKWTHKTHEERQVDQITKAERVWHTREAMEVAMATGEKQLVGKDAQGRDVYVEPPSYSQYNPGGYYPYGYGGLGNGCYGYGPYGAGLGLNTLLLSGLCFGGFW